jgi:hypothetical protein
MYQRLQYDCFTMNPYTRDEQYTFNLSFYPSIDPGSVGSIYHTAANSLSNFLYLGSDLLYGYITRGAVDAYKPKLLTS